MKEDILALSFSSETFLNINVMYYFIYNNPHVVGFNKVVDFSVKFAAGCEALVCFEQKACLRLTADVRGIKGRAR